MGPFYSIVVPVFNEQDNIPALIGQLTAIMEKQLKPYELILVDDGSTDGTFDTILQLNAEDARVMGLSLSRNFGHQNALLAGLRHATGACVITMDGDLQHPPAVIEQLIEKSEQGYDIVNTIRQDATATSTFKRATSRWYYRLLNHLAQQPIQPAAADFRLMNRRALEAFLRFQEKDRFTRGLVSWMGFKQAFVTYQAQPRQAGHSKYSLAKMLRLAVDGITSFSARPLYMALYLGIAVSSLGFLYGLYVLVVFALGRTVQGWTSLLLAVLLIGGVILINLGIVGIYIARVYNELKNRPHYFIDRATPNFPHE